MRISKTKAAAVKFAAVINAASIFLGCAAPLFAEADASVVTISSADEMAEFLKSCTSYAYSKDKTFIIDNDIDMDNKEFTSGGIFCGTLMGNGHVIKNISIDFREANGGLFTNISEEGQIRDLNLSGEFKQHTNSSDETSTESIVSDLMKNAGISGVSPTQSTGITGAIAAVNSGLIVNCTFEGSLSGQKTSGGIVGQNKDTGIIDTCANAGTIQGYEVTGGIAGENAGVIKNSRNTGSINPEAEETTRETGGIAGYSSGVIEYSSNEGSVGCEGYGTNAGGIAGKQNGCIQECKNSGYVGAKKNAGGIVGIFVPFTETEIIADDLKNEFEKQKNDIKSEADKLRDNLKKDAESFKDGLNIFNGSLPSLGLSGNTDGLDKVLNSLSAYIDSATENKKKVTDSVSNGLDSMSESADSLSDGINSLSDLAGALENAVNERSADKALEEQLVSSLDSISNSVSDVSNSLANALDTTASLNDDINKLTNSLTTTLDTASTSMTTAAKNRTQVSDAVSDALYRIDLDTSALDDAAYSLRVLSRTLEDVVDDISDGVYDTKRTLLAPFRTLNTEINKIIKDIEDRKLDLESLKKRLENLRADLEDEFKEIEETIGTPEPLPTVRPTTKVGEAILDSLFTKAYAADDDSDGSKLLDLDEILDTQRIKEEMKKVISVDVTLDRNVAGEYTDTALVKNCINKGEIASTENAGGITGNMGIETLRRKGETIQLPDGKSVVSDMAVKAVINSCINDGKIYAKERFAGGIAGASNVGIIKNCLGAGEVCAENSGYAGGIGGSMNASILFSVGAARLSGKNDLGGIAGSGNVIRECYSIASFDGDAERIGMIAGSADGDVSNNCFISEGVGGIGGASYENDAEDIPFADMKCTDRLPEKMDMFFNDDWVSETDCFPQIKSLAQPDASVIGLDLRALSAKYAETVFTVNFIRDGETIKSLKKNYNEYLSEDEIPTLTGADGRYPHWDRDTSEPIRRHTNFIAEYNEATTTIASDEDPPILLVEGNFSENTKVSVTQAEVTADFPGYSKGNAYSFKIEPKKDAEDGFRLHILCRDTAGTAIGIVNDGNAEIIDCERDGSYLICDMSAPYTFVILNKEGKALPVTIIILCAGILAFLAAGTVTVRRKRRLRAAKDKNEDTDTTPDDVEEEPDNSDGDTSGDAEEVIYLEPDDVIDAEDDE